MSSDIEEYKKRKDHQNSIINIDNILNAKIVNDPWPHAVIDNVWNLNLGPDKNNRLPNATYVMWMNGVHDIFYDNIEPILNKFRSDRGGYRERDKDLYYIDYALQVQPPNSTSVIHIDHGRKHWSFVNYLFPSNSNGTGLFDENKKFVTEIEWKSNRGLAFSSSGPSSTSSATWHEYRNDSETDYRITMAVFICKRNE